MEIDIRSKDFELSESIMHSTKESILKKIEKYRKLILSVKIWFTDTNGPKGGIDKKCLVKISTKYKDSIIIQEEGSNLYELIVNIGDRINNVLQKRKEKRKRRIALDY
ncbi:MAG: HPF/RaiA family ribosome-associated protein [Proteobacteria bacterium]|nr:HPF/RaiA family ribosome-associated protein [Pseudomonadota bacterium]